MQGLKNVKSNKRTTTLDVIKGMTLLQSHIQIKEGLYS